MIDSREVFEAEFSLIACTMIDPAIIEPAEMLIGESDFGLRHHGKAWSAILDMHAAGGPCGDSRQVLAMLARIGVLEAIGGVKRFLDARSAFPHHWKHYAGIVKQGSQWRKMDKVASEIRKRLDTESTPAEVAHWVASEVSTILGAEAGITSSIGESARQALELIEKAMAAGQSANLKTGLDRFDSDFGGMFPSELVVLAARPSIGKTALATQIAMHVAATQGSVLLASLEMKGTDLVMRMFAKDTKVSVRDLRCGKVSEDDLLEIRGSAARLERTNVELLASRNVTPEKIRAAARLQKSIGELSLVVVDYIGLVKASDPRKDKYTRVSESCEKLKDLAMELDVPVLCLSQLNRVAEKEKPGIHHLRDSGNIEQDADTVWLLHRETRSSEEATIEVAKARQGATGEHKLRFDPETTTFYEGGARHMANYVNDFDEYGGPADDGFEF